MLTKLIRHEFRATSRIMWPIFAGMLALTLAMGALLIVSIRGGRKIAAEYKPGTAAGENAKH